MSEMKRCGRCGEAKPVEAFYRFKGHSSGRQAWCKACMAEVNRAWRADPEVKARLAEYMRGYRRRKKSK